MKTLQNLKQTAEQLGKAMQVLHLTAKQIVHTTTADAGECFHFTFLASSELSQSR